MLVIVDGFRLGIDFGSSNTVAVLAGPDGQVRPLLFDGSPTLPSAVCAQPNGTLLVGRDAWHAARMFPAGFEPTPKRLIDDGTVLLGEVEFPVEELIAAVLGRVAAEAGRVAGGLPASVTVTCPVAWGPRRRDLLLAAASTASLGVPTLVAEPVAAAAFFAARPAGGIPAGGHLLVYDFGAGTFDVSVVRRAGAGSFEVLAEHGLSDAGGLDVDAAIMAHLAASYADRDPGAWARLAAPATADDRRAARTLWDDIRAAKEVLSRTAATYIHLPLLGVDAPLGRAQFEQLARPILDRTVAATRTAIGDAGLEPADIGGLYLVGGSSRIPLAATLLHQALGVAPTVLEQPELVVAHGSLTHPETRPAPTGAPPGPTWTAPAAPPRPVPSSPSPGEPSVGIETITDHTDHTTPAGPPPALRPAAAEPPRQVAPPPAPASSPSPFPAPPPASTGAQATRPARRRRRRALVSALIGGALAVAVLAGWLYTSRSPTHPPSSAEITVVGAKIVVFLNNDATDDDKDAIRRTLAGFRLIGDIRFETKQEAWDTFKHEYRDAPDLVNATRPDSLPESFHATLIDPADVEPATVQLQNLRGVNEVIRDAIRVETPQYHMDIVFQPWRIGVNTVKAFVYTPGGAALKVAGGQAIATPPAGDRTPLRVSLQPLTNPSAGNAVGGEVRLTAPGVWQLRVTIRLSTGAEVTVTVNAPVG